MQAEGCDAEDTHLESSCSPDVCVSSVWDGAFEYTLVGRDGLGLHPVTGIEVTLDIEQGPMRRV